MSTRKSSQSPDQQYFGEFSIAFGKRFDRFPHEHDPEKYKDFLYHQKIANEKLHKAVEEGRRSLALILACGTGKTLLGLNAVAASQAAKRTLNVNGGRRDFFLTVETGIADQAYQEARGFGLDAGRWFGGKRELDRPFVVATIQALQTNIAIGRRRFRRLVPPGTTDLCVFDEADCHLTDNRVAVRDELAPRIQLAMTATGEWPDRRSVEDEEHFGPAVERMDLKEALLAGICAVPDIYFYESEIDGDSITMRNRDYKLEELGTACWHAELHLALADVYQQVVPRNKRRQCPTLMYVPSVKMVEAEVESMREVCGPGIVVEGLAGKKVTYSEQKRVTDDFRHGRTHVLIACRRGGRGWNLENTVLVIDGFPTYSLNKITHQDCRGLRKILPGSDLWEEGIRKEDAMLIQVVPKSMRRRPALFTDVLGGYQQYQAIRRKLHRKGPGAPTESLVDELRRRIEAQNPVHRLRLVTQVNALEAIERIDEIYPEDEKGFFEAPPRYGPHR